MSKSIDFEIFLKKSDLRRLVWARLTKMRTVTELAKELGRHRSSVSRVLLDFEKAGYVKCLNYADASFRCYARG
jgi:DNA-binding IclR family transcriptional regulator